MWYRGRECAVQCGLKEECAAGFDLQEGNVQCSVV